MGRKIKITKVERRGPDECWPWTGSVNQYGYGDSSHKGKHVHAHRKMWILESGDPGELSVLHRCDNPRCCNPNHLFLGTQADNMADKVHKGRQAHSERHGHAKLTADQVVYARKAVWTGRHTTAQLARHFGVDPCTITDLVKRRTWKHIE